MIRLFRKRVDGNKVFEAVQFVYGNGTVAPLVEFCHPATVVTSMQRHPGAIAEALITNEKGEQTKMFANDWIVRLGKNKKFALN